MKKEEIKKVILELATARGTDKTICPSEVARNMFGEKWRNNMQNVRDAAFDLEAKDEILIMQKGQKVDPKEVKGPIRIRIQKNPD